jgi:hypothetical protein
LKNEEMKNVLFLIFGCLGTTTQYIQVIPQTPTTYVPTGVPTPII